MTFTIPFNVCFFKIFCENQLFFTPFKLLILLGYSQSTPIR